MLIFRFESLQGASGLHANSHAVCTAQPMIGCLNILQCHKVYSLKQICCQQLVTNKYSVTSFLLLLAAPSPCLRSCLPGSVTPSQHPTLLIFPLYILRQCGGVLCLSNYHLFAIASLCGRSVFILAGDCVGPATFGTFGAHGRVMLLRSK